MMGDLNMNGRLLRGLLVESRPVYDGDEAVSWAQLTNHLRSTLRPFATRGYVDGKCADLAARVRHKPVIVVTATPAMLGSVATRFKFTEVVSKSNATYYTMSAGRIIRMCLFRTGFGNTSIGVEVNNGRQHIMRLRNTTPAAENVSIDFNFNSRITLPVLDGGGPIHTSDHMVLLLELDL